jgi:hypothetical protein
MRATAAGGPGRNSPSTMTAIASGGGVGPTDPLPPLKDDDYLVFAKSLNASASTDRISSHKFKRGLLRYGIVHREEDATTICLELNSSGGDLLLSAVRNKIVNKDPKLCNLLKKYIRTVLDNQPGSTRDRVLGKIISRAGETMTPEINLLRSSMNTYKYIEGDTSLLDIKDDVIDVVPVRSGIAAATELSPSSASSQRSYLPETAPSRASVHIPPHSSSRDRILGKIISNAVNTVSLEKPAAEDQPPTQDLTPRAVPHHSSRDKVLAKIISNAVSAAGGGGSGGGASTSSGEPSSSQLHFPAIGQGKGSAVYAPLRGSESSFGAGAPLAIPVGTEQDEGDCALQDYNDDLSFSQSHRVKNQTPQPPQESKGGSEAKRRVTYDPEKHSSLYSNPSNEYLQVDMETMNDNRHLLDRTLSRESSRPRRHSENSICENPEVLEQMHSVRARGQLPRSPSKNISTGGGRVRNKILHRMVNRVKETVLPSSSSDSNKQRPLSGQQQREESEWLPKLKEKSQSPRHEASGRWFQHGKFSSTVAIDSSSCHPPASEQKPSEVLPTRDPSRLCIQIMESRVEGEGSEGPQEQLPQQRQSSSQPHRHARKENEVPKPAANSPNPLRHILSDAHLSIPPAEGSFSPGPRGKASPLHLSVSTPQPYRETYRRTLHPHHSPEDRALTPEPEVEAEEKSSEWKSSESQSCSTSSNQALRDRWVGAAPVPGGEHHRNRNQPSSQSHW